MNAKQAPESPSRLPLPGMAAIALWMLILAVIGVTGALSGHYPGRGSKAAVLVISSIFAFAGWGLILLRRWGWALTLGAAFCSMLFATYSIFRFRQSQWIAMAAVNLVFFLYLVRPEVQQRLKRSGDR